MYNRHVFHGTQRCQRPDADAGCPVTSRRLSVDHGTPFGTHPQWTGSEANAIAETCTHRPAFGDLGLLRSQSEIYRMAVIKTPLRIQFLKCHSMMLIRRLTVALIAIVLATSTAMAQSPELIVEIEKQEMFEGESVLYRVTLNHVENPSPPSLDGFDDFQVTPLGEQSMDSQQITIINGRRSEIIRRGRQYNYRLTPKKTGSLTIPAPTATVDGTTLTGEPVIVRVIAPEKQDSVILELNSDRSTVYPMQPFTISLTIAIKELPDIFAPRDPLTVQPQPPELSVPWLDDQQLPDGLQPATNWKEILQPLISRRGNGVQINNIGSSSVFSLFNDQATGFHPAPNKSQRTDSSGQEVGYWEYKLERTFVPRRQGTYSMGPVTLKGTFATDVQRGQLVGDQLYVVAPAVSITVRDVPLDGRPDSYIGAVGRFDVQTKMAPLTARVGDPMTLTLTITGQGTLEDARPPDLASVPGLEESFRTYEATQETNGTSRQFTYSLRPMNPQIAEFPAIPVSYFDVEAEQYRTITTPAIPVTITESEVLSTADIVAASPSENGSPNALQTREGGLFANDSTLQSLRDESIHPVRWVSAWGGMIAATFAASLVIGRIQRFRADPTLQRRATAVSRAQSALHEASALSVTGRVADACDVARRSVTTLVADYFDLAAAGLTSGDVLQQLQAVEIDQPQLQRIRQFLNDCDAARYGAATEDMKGLIQTAAELVQSLAVCLPKSVRLANRSRDLSMG